MKRIQKHVIQLLSISISWNGWNPSSKHKVRKVNFETKIWEKKLEFHITLLKKLIFLANFLFFFVENIYKFCYEKKL